MKAQLHSINSVPANLKLTASTDMNKSIMNSAPNYAKAVQPPRIPIFGGHVPGRMSAHGINLNVLQD